MHVFHMPGAAFGLRLGCVWATMAELRTRETLWPPFALKVCLPLVQSIPSLGERPFKMVHTLLKVARYTGDCSRIFVLFVKQTSVQVSICQFLPVFKNV